MLDEVITEKAFDQKVFETSLFGDLMPSQKAAVIESLRTRREGVIMVSRITSYSIHYTKLYEGHAEELVVALFKYLFKSIGAG